MFRCWVTGNCFIYSFFLYFFLDEVIHLLIFLLLKHCNWLWCQSERRLEETDWPLWLLSVSSDLDNKNKGSLGCVKVMRCLCPGGIQKHYQSWIWLLALPQTYAPGKKNTHLFTCTQPWLLIFPFSPLLQSQTAHCGSSSSWLARSGPQGGAFRNPGSRAGGEPGPERSKVTARPNRGQTGSQPAPIGADSASRRPHSHSVRTLVLRWLKAGVQTWR